MGKRIPGRQKHRVHCAPLNKEREKQTSSLWLNSLLTSLNPPFQDTDANISKLYSKLGFLSSLCFVNPPKVLTRTVRTWKGSKVSDAKHVLVTKALNAYLLPFKHRVSPSGFQGLFGVPGQVLHPTPYSQCGSEGLLPGMEIFNNPVICICPI